MVHLVVDAVWVVVGVLVLLEAMMALLLLLVGGMCSRGTQVIRAGAGSAATCAAIVAVVVVVYWCTDGVAIAGREDGRRGAQLAKVSGEGWHQRQ